MIRVLQIAAAGAMVFAMSASAAPRYTISRDAIAAAVRDAGMPVTADRIAPLAEVFSSVETPQLRVRSIEPDSGRQSVVRIECVRSSECLPFVVTIRNDRGTGSPAPEIHLLSASHPAVHTGSRIVLYLDSGRVHISLPVIALENGAIGQTVRATTTDRSKTYLAQVVDSSTLKGTF